MIESLREFWKAYDKDVNHRFYIFSHCILLLFLYEVLILFSRTPEVAVYDGVDFWFQFFYYVIPLGSLPFSLLIAIVLGWYLYLDYSGKKDGKELKQDAEKKKKDPSFEPSAKKPRRLNSVHFGAMALEGFVYGALLYILLPFIVFRITSFVVTDPLILQPFDTRELVRDLQTNLFQNVALSLGAGFYEEAIFRWGLVLLLFRWFRPKAAPGKKEASVNPHKPLAYLNMAFSTVAGERKTFWAVIGAMIAGAVLFSLSHYLLPAGDLLTEYSFIYRIIFGLSMNLLFITRRFAVAAWAHAWYDMLYFSFA
jgi:hypothetical protein